MKRYFLRVMTLACLGLLNLGFAHAQNKDTADGLVKFVVEDVMNTIKNDKAIQAGDLRKINTLVDQKILPYSNFQKTTRLAMGRNWNKATPAQQEQITQEFKNLLIRIYSGALAQVRDQKIQYKPFRAAADETDVIVRTVVIGKGEPIQIDYRVEKTNDGWKVYDINVLGAWLVESYRNQFNDQVSKGGIEGLVQFLQQRNAALAAGK
ncbi:ABC transporter substrate-binding protein [Polynucleobacter sp. MWH-Loch1C5]|uniref:MlaC/ttg2D family ABC transporter substrate-binding protein n=1 Tax=Polynucleobacter sp. MWH-Loch1C5 TaxID=2689108 RepID=UPI001C0B6EC5|nr:ABC transporter substrate-binding protein [Polynucleobacter sp. MWH-Loch1C5]MBU3542369.1 ABC transporter substrate-binding protein [Polynucleobacter sp. MWH-Loch1C5]